MFNPAVNSMRLSSVWGLDGLSLRVSPVIFRQQRAGGGGEQPAPGQAEGSGQIWD